MYWISTTISHNGSFFDGNLVVNTTNIVVSRLIDQFLLLRGNLVVFNKLF